MDKPTEPEEDKPRPDYPPKTPPPPKKPPSPPPPDAPRSDLLAGLPVPQRAGRGGHPVMRNRRGASWSLESAVWTPGKAARHVTAQLTAWGFTAPKALEQVVRFLAGTVIADGGRRVSVHLSEQGGLALVLCLSHQQVEDGETTDVLTALRELGTDSCGIEMTAEGRQVWALLPLQATASTPAGRTA
ncbi:hypothetical protein [Streptomyces sp. NPDC050264]|uniref:hypothetical protein n=1 Tax=Streptomyces sp. NPDC050264 TaxID=3155038 RepID=UPI00344632D1